MEKVICKRCGHEWQPMSNTLPKACPRCKSYEWQKPSGFKKEDGKLSRQRKWQLNNPEKDKAHQIKAKLLSTGEIERPLRCSDCGIACIPESHHPDYSKPHEIEWLCQECHRKRRWL